MGGSWGRLEPSPWLLLAEVSRHFDKANPDNILNWLRFDHIIEPCTFVIFCQLNVNLSSSYKHFTFLFFCECIFRLDCIINFQIIWLYTPIGTGKQKMYCFSVLQHSRNLRVKGLVDSNDCQKTSLYSVKWLNYLRALGIYRPVRMTTKLFGTLRVVAILKTYRVRGPNLFFEARPLRGPRLPQVWQTDVLTYGRTDRRADSHIKGALGLLVSNWINLKLSSGFCYQSKSRFNVENGMIIVEIHQKYGISFKFPRMLN